MVLQRLEEHHLKLWGLKYFCLYLMGHKYVVYTDHPAVQSSFHSQRSSSKLAWWTEIVAEFDVEIQYRPGHKNANADALSHSPIESSEDDDLLEVFQVTSAACEPNEGHSLKVVQEEMGKLEEKILFVGNYIMTQGWF